MSNRLGYVRTGRCGKYIQRKTLDGDSYLCELPDRLQEASDGLIVYVDRDGSLQVMEDDFFAVPGVV